MGDGDTPQPAPAPAPPAPIPPNVPAFARLLPLFHQWGAFTPQDDPAKVQAVGQQVAQQIGLDPLTFGQNLAQAHALTQLPPGRGLPTPLLTNPSDGPEPKYPPGWNLVYRLQHGFADPNYNPQPPAGYLQQLGGFAKGATDPQAIMRSMVGGGAQTLGWAGNKVGLVPDDMQRALAAQGQADTATTEGRLGAGSAGGAGLAALALSAGAGGGMTAPAILAGGQTASEIQAQGGGAFHQVAGGLAAAAGMAIAPSVGKAADVVIGNWAKGLPPALAKTLSAFGGAEIANASISAGSAAAQLPDARAAGQTFQQGMIGPQGLIFGALGAAGGLAGGLRGAEPPTPPAPVVAPPGRPATLSAGLAPMRAAAAKAPAPAAPAPKAATAPSAPVAPPVITPKSTAGDVYKALQQAKGDPQALKDVNAQIQAARAAPAPKAATAPSAAAPKAATAPSAPAPKAATAPSVPVVEPEEDGFTVPKGYMTDKAPTDLSPVGEKAAEFGAKQGEMAVAPDGTKGKVIGITNAATEPAFVLRTKDGYYIHPLGAAENLKPEGESHAAENHPQVPEAVREGGGEANVLQNRGSTGPEQGNLPTEQPGAVSPLDAPLAGKSSSDIPAPAKWLTHDDAIRELRSQIANGATELRQPEGQPDPVPTHRNPDFDRYMARPIVSADVPYAASISDDGSKVYVDRLVPNYIPCEKMDGTYANVDAKKYVLLHEGRERDILDSQPEIKYGDAHKAAEAIEERVVQKDNNLSDKGLAQYNAAWKLIDDAALKKGLGAPADIYRRPYEDEGRTDLLKPQGESHADIQAAIPGQGPGAGPASTRNGEPPAASAGIHPAADGAAGNAAPQPVNQPGAAEGPVDRSLPVGEKVFVKDPAAGTGADHAVYPLPEDAGYPTLSYRKTDGTQFSKPRFYLTQDDKGAWHMAEAPKFNKVHKNRALDEGRVPFLTNMDKEKGGYVTPGDAARDMIALLGERGETMAQKEGRARQIVSNVNRGSIPNPIDVLGDILDKSFARRPDLVGPGHYGEAVRNLVSGLSGHLINMPDRLLEAVHGWGTMQNAAQSSPLMRQARDELAVIDSEGKVIRNEATDALRAFDTLPSDSQVRVKKFADEAKRQGGVPPDGKYTLNFHDPITNAATKIALTPAEQSVYEGIRAQHDALARNWQDAGDKDTPITGCATLEDVKMRLSANEVADESLRDPLEMRLALGRQLAMYTNAAKYQKAAYWTSERDGNYLVRGFKGGEYVDDQGNVVPPDAAKPLIHKIQGGSREVAMAAQSQDDAARLVQKMRANGLQPTVQRITNERQGSSAGNLISLLDKANIPVESSAAVRDALLSAQTAAKGLGHTLPAEDVPGADMKPGSQGIAKNLNDGEASLRNFRKAEMEGRLGPSLSPVEKDLLHGLLFNRGDEFTNAASRITALHYLAANAASAAGINLCALVSNMRHFSALGGPTAFFKYALPAAKDSLRVYSPVNAAAALSSMVNGHSMEDNMVTHFLGQIDSAAERDAVNDAMKRGKFEPASLSEVLANQATTKFGHSIDTGLAWLLGLHRYVGTTNRLASWLGAFRMATDGDANFRAKCDLYGAPLAPRDFADWLTDRAHTPMDPTNRSFITSMPGPLGVAGRLLMPLNNWMAGQLAMEVSHAKAVYGAMKQHNPTMAADLLAGHLTGLAAVAAIVGIGGTVGGGAALNLMHMGGTPAQSATNEAAGHTLESGFIHAGLEKAGMPQAAAFWDSLAHRGGDDPIPAGISVPPSYQTGKDIITGAMNMFGQKSREQLRAGDTSGVTDAAASILGSTAKRGVQVARMVQGKGLVNPNTGATVFGDKELRDANFPGAVASKVAGGPVVGKVNGATLSEDDIRALHQTKQAEQHGEGATRTSHLDACAQAIVDWRAGRISGDEKTSRIQREAQQMVKEFRQDMAKGMPVSPLSGPLLDRAIKGAYFKKLGEADPTSLKGMKGVDAAQYLEAYRQVVGAP